MKKRPRTLLAAGALLPLAALAAYAAATRIDPNPQHAVGEQLDELNGVAIYYNGGVNTVQGRNLTQDGYNLGFAINALSSSNATISNAMGTACRTPTGMPKTFSIVASVMAA